MNCSGASSVRRSCRLGAPSIRTRQDQRRAVVVPPSAVPRTAYSFETQRLVKCLLTRQALKTMLNYLMETNGELHLYLHNYVHAHPLVLDGQQDPDEWLVQLASSPLTTIEDPRRSAVVSAASAAAALNGSREVSPREIAERLMGLREHISREMVEELERVPEDHRLIKRRTLEKTFKELNFDKP